MYERFVVSLYVLAGVSAVFALLSWRKRGDPGGAPMVVFHLALAIGAVSYALDITSTALPAQIRYRQVATIAQSVVAIAWLFAAFQYANFGRRLTRRVIGLLALEPVLLAMAYLLPAVTVIEWPASGSLGSLSRASGTVLTPLFVVHIGTILMAALAGSLVLVRLFVRSRHLYRTQAAAVLIAALAPWSVGLTQQFFLSVPEDASIFAWGISGVALTAGLYTFKTLDPVPAANATIVDTMGDGTLVLDRDGCISDANPVARELLAADEGSLVGRDMDDVIDDWDHCNGAASEHGGWRELSLDADGTRRYLEVETTPFTDRFGDEIGTLVVMRDVTDRKRREQRLAQYKTIFHSVTEPVYVLDEDDRFLRYNDPFADLVGVDERALVGEPFSEVLGPTAVVTDGGVQQLADATITTADGTEVPCEADLAPVALVDGAEGRVGIIRDISRRKAIESELAETTERLETLVEASPLAIIAHDADGIVDVWNPAAEGLFGWTADEVEGERLPIVPPEREGELTARHEAVHSGERLTGYETVLQRKDGERLPASVSAAPIADAAGDIVGTVAIIADISERRERQRRLERQNERLEEFAGIVSHDLQNPLQVATGNLELARQADPDEAATFLESADDALERMADLIDDTLALARRGRDIGQTETCRLETLATAAWNSVQSDGGALVLREPPAIDCDPDRVQELLENLFSNALTHGPGDDDAAVTVTVGEMSGGFYVADDGRGIAEDERESVFQSGYTTAREGTGFGLAIVETIADAHGWTVSVTTSDDGGARFEFTGVEQAD